MRIVLILLFTLISKNILAVTIEEIINVLDKKDYSTFEHYIEKRNSSSHCSDPGEIRKREILAHYHEIIVPVLIFIPTPDGKHEGDCTYYVINILTYGNKIIKYEVYSKKFDDSETKNYKLIKEYSNQHELRSFETAYKENYYRTISPVELFDVSTTYGSHCGIIGINPTTRTELEDHILSKNVAALFNWLTSPNYEKKLYAYEGYRALIQSGYKTSTKEKTLLDNLKTFKGLVRTCSGCFFMDDGFRGVLNRIDDQKFDTIKKTRDTIDIASNNNKQHLPGNNTKDESLKLILIASLVFGGGMVFTVFARRRNLS